MEGFRFETTGLRQTFDERTSAWVAFPHMQVKFALPIVKRGRRLVPVFHDDGSVGLDIQDADAELAKTVDDFVLSISKAHVKEKGIALVRHYGLFVKTVKALLGLNYDLTDDQFRGILTVTESELAAMFSTIFKHCLSQ